MPRKLIRESLDFHFFLGEAPDPRSGARQDQGNYWWPIGSHIRAFDWCQNQRPWMTLKGYYALCFKTHASFGAQTTKIWMKIDPYYLRRRRSPVTLVSGNIRSMRIFAGFPWRVAVKRQWDNRKRHLSPFHWPKIHDLQWPFYVKFSLHLLRTVFEWLFLHTYHWACLYLALSSLVVSPD